MEGVLLGGSFGKQVWLECQRFSESQRFSDVKFLQPKGSEERA